MKTFKKLFRIIFFVVCPNYLFSDTFNKGDLNFLNYNDKKFFIEKCLEKKKNKDTPRCLNFLGLKILLNNLDNLEISKETLKYIENQAIYYLKEAAERGFIEAYINLGWIYSNDKFEFQDLKKSADYFKLYHNLNIKGRQIKNLKTEKKDKNIIDRKQIILGILSIQKLDLYKILWPNDKNIQLNKLDTHLTNLKNLFEKEFNYNLNYFSKQSIIKLLIN